MIKKNELSGYSLVTLVESVSPNFTKGKVFWFKWISKRPKLFNLSSIDGKKSIELKKEYLNKIKHLH